MKVPSVDYSPIEQANRAKNNALRAGYAAKNAELFSVRHQRNLEAFELQEDAFELQEKQLELDRWQSSVDTALNLVNSGISVAQEIYDLKLSRQKQQGQLMLDSFRNEYRNAAALYQDEYKIEYDEDGNPYLVKPDALKELEQDFYDRMKEVDWLPDMESVMETGLSSVFSDIEFDYINASVDRENEAMAAALETNLQSALNSDVNAGLDQPYNTFRVIDSMPKLSEEGKTALKATWTKTYQNELEKNNIMTLVRTQGTTEAMKYIDGLSDRTEEEKIELKGVARSAEENLRSDATSVAQSIYESNIKDFPTLNCVKAAYDSIDATFSDENGYGEESRSMIKDALEQFHISELQEYSSRMINRALDSNDPYSELERLQTRIGEDGDLTGYFYNQDDLLRAARNTISKHMGEIHAKYGKSVKTNAQKEVKNLENRLELKQIDNKEFVSSLFELYEQYKDLDFDIDSIITDSYKSYLATQIGNADPVVDHIFGKIADDRNWPKEDDMDTETYMQASALKKKLYEDIGDYVVSHAGVWDNNDFSEFVDQTLALYNDSYFDIVNTDVNKNTAFKSDFRRASDVLNQTFTDDFTNIIKEPMDSGLIEQGGVEFEDDALTGQVDKAISRVMEHYNANKGYSFVGYEYFYDKDTGTLKIGFRDKNRDGYFMFDPASRTLKEPR